jgi:hypothetical protein
VTFPTALKTEITAKGDIRVYSEVVRELIALNVLNVLYAYPYEYLNSRICISFGQLIIFPLKFVLTANLDTGKP